MQLSQVLDSAFRGARLPAREPDAQYHCQCQELLPDSRRFIQWVSARAFSQVPLPYRSPFKTEYFDVGSDGAPPNDGHVSPRSLRAGAPPPADDNANELSSNKDVNDYLPSQRCVSHADAPVEVKGEPL